ncbi:unnamed protein product [Litomosoides sigmodontis]|uniref:Uncharacterized protein n=1 Tax=Litomosoides sigmodontis TaxID=42156 RepID=A0A3P6SLV9_LITSI|nr:unnamed protein product [Litomosoides sigmodontis]
MSAAADGEGCFERSVSLLLASATEEISRTNGLHFCVVNFTNPDPTTGVGFRSLQVDRKDESTRNASFIASCESKLVWDQALGIIS